MIVGIVIGIFAVCFLLAIGVYIKMKKKINLEKLPDDVKLHYQQYYTNQTGNLAFILKNSTIFHSLTFFAGLLSLVLMDHISPIPLLNLKRLFFL